jgi:transposase
MNRASFGSARDGSRGWQLPELGGGPDGDRSRVYVHRRQITFDALDTETGEVTRGRIDATPAAVACWAKRFGDREVHVAVEACTGWLFVCDALAAAGAVAHLAGPVEARALRGRKRRAKTDREDARWLRELLGDGRLPEAWIPP